MKRDELIDYLSDFLRSIGIDVIEKTLADNTFLPGLSMKANALLIDRNKLKYPGDILHEAGHIAVTENKLRSLIGSDDMPEKWPEQSNEMAAILWSFAACHHLKIDLDVVFHPYGYKDHSDWYMEQFNSSNYIGIYLLEWMGLCTQENFPKMAKWVR